MNNTSTDWFELLTGFRETTWEETRARLEVTNGRLRSRVNNRSFAIGELELPTLAELRARALLDADRVRGRLSLTNVSGDVGAMHRDPANRGAVFQVASQFNLLEMINEDVTPEDGVARYRYDPTQGPACAIAAGAATIYRNYFVPIGDQTGQTATRQLDCLADLGAAFGNTGSRLWTMRNGYALGAQDGLAEIDQKLASADSAQVDAWRDLLRIGIHWNVEVLGAGGDESLPSPAQVVTQAFCSALPVAYSDVPATHWRRFASLVLEGAYEATLWAAVINAARADAPLALILPSASYWAYANTHHVLERREGELVRTNFTTVDATTLFLHEHPEYGCSMYDRHSDGSGVCISSRLRPVLTIRPRERLWQLPADTHIIDWLDARAIAYDVICEDDLDQDGLALLASYRCVMTGTHPEYPSKRMIDAFAAFQGQGGRFIYMGGNGFYWRTSYHPTLPGVIEMRRTEDGLRTWFAEAGEYYHAFTGEMGGMWRRMGHAPQSVAGTGMTAQGFDRSTWYRRLEASHDPRAAFIFDGIGPTSGSETSDGSAAAPPAGKSIGPTSGSAPRRMHWSWRPPTTSVMPTIG